MSIQTQSIWPHVVITFSTAKNEKLGHVQYFVLVHRYKEYKEILNTHVTRQIASYYVSEIEIHVKMDML